MTLLITRSKALGKIHLCSPWAQIYWMILEVFQELCVSVSAYKTVIFREVFYGNTSRQCLQGIVCCLFGFFFYREVDLEVKSKIINLIISSLKWQDFF